MSAVITPFEGTELFNMASFNNRISQINTGFSYVSNPNLLDNWYFGNPVNQRNGYIVPAGVAYYKVEGYVPQGPMPETIRVDYIDAAGSARFNYGGVACYVPKDGGYVRGYTGAWSYTIDRWQLGDGNISLSVADGGIALKGGGVVGSDYIFTRVERLPVAKYTYTILFSGNTGQVALSNKSTDTGVVTAVTSRAASGVLSLTWDQTTEFTSSDAFLRIHALGSVNILAVKLELGPTQTLAHQENGQWVLNEIPDYGEQLRRCQRYCFVWGYSAKRTSCLAVMQAYEPERLFGLIPTPVTMRGTPVVTGGSLTTFGGMVTSLWSLNLCANGIRAVASVNGANFAVGQAVGIENADDNGKVIFSADL